MGYKLEMSLSWKKATVEHPVKFDDGYRTQRHFLQQKKGHLAGICIIYVPEPALSSLWDRFLSVRDICALLLNDW